MVNTEGRSRKGRIVSSYKTRGCVALCATFAVPIAYLILKIALLPVFIPSRTLDVVFFAALPLMGFVGLAAHHLLAMSVSADGRAHRGRAIACCVALLLNVPALPYEAMGAASYVSDEVPLDIEGTGCVVILDFDILGDQNTANLYRSLGPLGHSPRPMGTVDLGDDAGSTYFWEHQKLVESRHGAFAELASRSFTKETSSSDHG